MKRLYSIWPIVTMCALMVLASGCAGTRAAYQSTEGDPSKVAYVVAEHYAALVKQAADRKDAGTLTGSALAAAQAADRKAKPFIIGDPDAVPPKAGIEQLAKACEKVCSQKDEAALREALPGAVQAVNDFINTLKGVRQ